MFWEEDKDVEILEFFTIEDADEIQHLMNEESTDETDVVFEEEFAQQLNLNENLLFPFYIEQAA